ncbi:MAG: molybdopterin-dependent oxidoreductase [Vulcanococcus sp. Clear-D1]|jgi:DMSO/TMAO reductase YedYZ molybdopterin-dependent catalytic subunit|nr:molybdopterin-dependent oxidoreductase [Vulcanococcus sp. Clear-D1]
MKRRSLLQSALGTGGLLSLGGCALNPLGQEVAQLTRPLNERIEAWMQATTPVPEFKRNQVEPAALLVNSFNGIPEINLDNFSLTVDGLVQQPQQLGLSTLGQLPQQEIVIRHVCVEGWAAIVAWGGVRLADVLRLAEVSPLAGYVAFESADGYFETWDLRTALHPQTLLATQMNGAPLPVANGAPLRLTSPLKLGYKLSKWITAIHVLDTLNPHRLGTWEDQGYEWYAGL